MKRKKADRLSDVVSTLAHELKTPLTAMRAYSSALIEGEVGTLTAKQLEFLRVLHRNTLLLSQLVDQTLDVRAIKRGERGILKVAVDAQAIISQVIATFKLQASEKNIRLEGPIRKEAISLLTDPVRLEQILNNLVSNAIKHTDKGYVWIQTAWAGTPKKKKLVIRVEDTGPGMKTTHKSYPTGHRLGLGIVRGLAQALQAKLKFESKAGKGSCVTIELRTE